MSKLSMSGMSFFDHEEFEFAKNSDVENDEVNIKANRISIALLNHSTYTGQSLNGIVNIYVENKLPRGQIKLIVKTTIKIKIKNCLENNTIQQIITNFQEQLNTQQK